MISKIVAGRPRPAAPGFEMVRDCDGGKLILGMANAIYCST